VGRLRRLYHGITGDLVLGRAMRNGGWLLGGSGITSLFALIQGALLTRALGVGQYGVYAVVTTFVTVVNRLTSFRMNEFVVKYVSDSVGASDRDGAAAAVKLAMLTEAAASLLAFLVLMALAPLGATWFVHDPAAVRPIQLYSLTVLAMLVAESSVGVLQVFGRFRVQALLNVLGAGVFLGATTLAFVLDGRLEAMLWAAVSAAGISWAAMTWAAFRAVQDACGPRWWRVPLQRLGTTRRAALGFALSTNASATLSLVTRDADPLCVHDRELCGHAGGAARAGVLSGDRSRGRGQLLGRVSTAAAARDGHRWGLRASGLARRCPCRPRAHSDRVRDSVRARGHGPCAPLCRDGVRQRALLEPSGAARAGAG